MKVYKSINANKYIQLTKYDKKCKKCEAIIQCDER